MRFSEAQKECDKTKSIAWYLYPDTINQILMDLYIGYQNNTEDAIDSRNSHKREIVKIIDSFKSTVRLTKDIRGLSEDDTEWGIEDTAEHWIDKEVFMVVNYILNHESEKPPYIPDVFRDRLSSKHMHLTYIEFYKYR